MKTELCGKATCCCGDFRSYALATVLLKDSNVVNPCDASRYKQRRRTDRAVVQPSQEVPDSLRPDLDESGSDRSPLTVAVERVAMMVEE